MFELKHRKLVYIIIKKERRKRDLDIENTLNLNVWLDRSYFVKFIKIESSILVTKELKIARLLTLFSSSVCSFATIKS